MPERENNFELFRQVSLIEAGGDRNFLFATATSEENANSQKSLVEEILTQGGQAEAVVRVLKLKENLFAIIHINDLEILEPPLPSGSEESQARYFFRSRYKSPAVQGYVLSAGEETSYHGHLKHTEKIEIIYGDADFIVDDDIENKRVRQINQNETHMLKAKEDSIVIVVTSGSDDCFARDDHHHKPKPAFLTAA